MMSLGYNMRKIYKPISSKPKMAGLTEIKVFYITNRFK